MNYLEQGPKISGKLWRPQPLVALVKDLYLLLFISIFKLSLECARHPASVTQP